MGKVLQMNFACMQSLVLKVYDPHTILFQLVQRSLAFYLEASLRQSYYKVEKTFPSLEKAKIVKTTTSELKPSLLHLP